MLNLEKKHSGNHLISYKYKLVWNVGFSPQM